MLIGVHSAQAYLMLVDFIRLSLDSNRVETGLGGKTGSLKSLEKTGVELRIKESYRKSQAS